MMTLSARQSGAPGYPGATCAALKPALRSSPTRFGSALIRWLRAMFVFSQARAPAIAAGSIGAAGVASPADGADGADGARVTVGAAVRAVLVRGAGCDEPEVTA